MVNIIKQEIEIEETLKNKIEFICGFCNTTPTIFNGSIRTIEHTNLTYVEPHRIIIKDKMFLAFNYETNIYIENLTNSIMLKDLERLVPSFKVANATIHFDESSPHMHIVGIAIKDNCKTGMKKQVGKTSIFTKDSLKIIQEEMRKACIKSYNKTYGLDSKLKDKKKGRNKDYTVSQMVHYDELVIEYDNHQKLIEQANNKTKKLDNKSNEVKEILTNLKQQPLNKNNLVISNENKQILLDYIEEVNKINQNVRDIANFTISLDKVKEDLEDNQERIEELETIKYEQKLKIDSLEISVNTKQQKIEKQKEDIIKLKQDKKDLNDLIDYWKNKFLEIIKLIKDKLFGKKEEREQYMDIANELYNKDIIDTKLFDEMYNIYEKIEKYDNNRGKFDDFEL